jgi:hypothetical protein
LAEKKRILHILPAPPIKENAWTSEAMEKTFPEYVSPGFEAAFRGVKYGGYEGFYYREGGVCRGYLAVLSGTWRLRRERGRENPGCRRRGVFSQCSVDVRG